MPQTSDPQNYVSMNRQNFYNPRTLAQTNKNYFTVVERDTVNKYDSTVVLQ